MIRLVKLLRDERTTGLVTLLRSIAASVSGDSGPFVAVDTPIIFQR
tara:strand:+ start:596 stop:733 length:138 start_codon:yes stop_codon:yes gene_type:complete